MKCHVPHWSDMISFISSHHLEGVIGSHKVALKAPISSQQASLLPSLQLCFSVSILQCVECLTRSSKCLTSRNLSKVNLTLRFPGFTEDPITLFLLGDFYYLHKEMEPLEMFVT